MIEKHLSTKNTKGTKWGNQVVRHKTEFLANFAPVFFVNFVFFVDRN